MTIATEIPVLFSLTFIYSSARAQSVSALRTKSDPREDTPPDMIVLAKVKSALAQIELSQIEYFLHYDRFMGVLCDCPLFLWHVQFFLRLYADFLGLSQERVAQVNWIFKNSLDSRIIP